MAENYFSKNLKYLREKSGTKQMDLAIYLDKKSESSISDWEKGKYTPKVDVLNMIAKYFHVTLSDLMERDLSVPEPADNMVPVTDFVQIPILGEIACGDPILADQNIQDYYLRSKQDLPSGRLFMLHAKGKSMEPAIQDGAKVLCRLQPDVENGEVAAVLVNGDTEATLKRVRKVNDMIILEPLNDDFEPYVITKDNPGRIIGKALEVYTTLNF